MPEFPIFRGNCPRNVSKDAKYTVRSGKPGPLIGLMYSTIDGERWYMTNERHPELVAMVNAVKTAHGNPPNGSFYINEYKQVIVPVAHSDEYYLAGTYDKTLRFEFEGKTLSGEPVDLTGNPLSPGDEWIGPHPGVPYVLAAGGNDVYYRSNPRPNVTKDIKLSNVRSADAAKKIAGQIRAVKGFAGGRFYVNECCSIFSPVNDGAGWRYLFIGTLDLACWFPLPTTT